ncbi:MAG: SAM-dependent methyltransferase [Caldilineaceae bacterium]|nr:SAM-dependent methyltransferase [Caldilineaceae bacterium]
MPSAHTNFDAINAHSVDFLLSAEGMAAAAQLVAVDDEHLLAELAHLRRRFTPEQAGALVALARLRRRAAAKFPAADRLFFSSAALEQATAYPIAAHHAAHLDQHAPPGPILDLGSGIGGDTLALAQHRPVIAYEIDPLRLRLAEANVQAMGLAHRVTFQQADWTAELAAGRLPNAAAAFADPARRIGEQRIYRLDQIQPPISALLQLQSQIPSVGVKVMPGVDKAEIPPDCGVEFISHEGVCKEAVLWFGPLASYPVWASVHTPAGWLMLNDTTPPPLGPLTAGMILHEPDPAVIRAGTFAPLCTALGAHLFDSMIAYLVGDQAITHPLVQSFRILEIHPFNLKLLQARLQALGISRLELKKRGAPFAPESLRGRLKLSTEEHAGVVIFTRQGDARLMLLGERLEVA